MFERIIGKTDIPLYTLTENIIRDCTANFNKKSKHIYHAWTANKYCFASETLKRVQLLNNRNARKYGFTVFCLFRARVGSLSTVCFDSTFVTLRTALSESDNIRFPKKTALALFEGLPSDFSAIELYKDRRNEIDLNLNTVRALEYLVYAIENPTQEVEELQNHPEKIVPLSWEELKWKLTDGKPKKIPKVASSEKFMTEILWRILEAAKEGGEI